MFFLNAYADPVNKKYEPKEKGILALMYHRFEENKYPSTNIKIDVFQEHLNIIKENNFSFLNPKNFELEFNKVSREKKILLTIDDAFSSFYLNAWPILKKDKIPFILFVSTEAVGNKGYMSWDEIIEISNEDFVFIGNHSHSHEYLVKYNFEKIEKDILKSIKIFEKFTPNKGLFKNILWQLLCIYIKSYILVVRPKAVITSIDNCNKFAWLSKNIPEIPFIAIQNGFRLNYAVDKESLYNCQHLFCFGQREIIEFPRMNYRVDNFHPVGSLNLSLNFDKQLIDIKPKYDLLVVHK